MCVQEAHPSDKLPMSFRQVTQPECDFFNIEKESRCAKQLLSGFPIEHYDLSTSQLF